MSDQTIYPRVRITGVLTCVSALHIGDGAEPRRWGKRWDKGNPYPQQREKQDLSQCKDPDQHGIEQAASERECTYHGVCHGYRLTRRDDQITNPSTEQAPDTPITSDQPDQGSADNDQPPPDQATVAATLEVPYLPGSTLRGVLRRLLEQPDLDQPNARPADALVQRLFGFVETPEQGGGQAGRLRVYDAPLIPGQRQFTDAAPPPFWSGRDHTAIRHGIAIDDQLGTVTHGLLYSHELIPAGSAFRIEIEADRLTHAELAALLGLLERLDGGLASAIGAKVGKGQGRVRWEAVQARVEVITAAALAAWVQDPDADAPLPFTPLADLAPVAPAADPRPDSIPIRLIADGPILINEPGYRARKLTAKEKKDGAEVPPTHEHSRRPDGTPILPGTSLVGVLRARARRIVATIAHRHHHQAPADALNIADDLIERLFGSEARRGALWLADAVCDGSNREHLQHFIAVDRFTGGVKGQHGEGALFAVCACADGAYKGELLLETRRLVHQEHTGKHPDWWRGLLWLLLRDATVGELRIGWGKAKGYGAFHVEFPSQPPLPGEPTPWLTALHAQVRAEIEKAQGVLAEPPAEQPAARSAQALPRCPEPVAQPPQAQVAPSGPATPAPRVFYLPYQFLPATGCIDSARVTTTPWQQVRAGTAADGEPLPIRHDLWLEGTWSGRLWCRLTLETDTFVGDRHATVRDADGNPDPANLILPYLRHDDRAIPGNSLRGMIASVAEAISQSALRVLEDRYYSVRKVVSEALQHEGTLNQVGPDWFVTLENGEVILVAAGVMERFSRLWVERSIKGEMDSKVPVSVKEHLPNVTHNAAPDRWRPPSGSPVYCRIGNNPRLITEISFSMIWRQEIPKTAHQFFAAISTDLLPWGTEQRTGLTPAEALFGVVEDEKQDQRGAACLASRVRIHDALPRFHQAGNEVECQSAPKVLRILASPKPPSPALYFHPVGKRGGFIKKQDLGSPDNDHRPNGRKFYLHHPEDQTDKQWWWSCDDENPQTRKQKVKIAPMLAGKETEFWFTIEFENLSPAELTLLRTAVAPGPDFLHHLGLGKPLGLGSVRVSIEAIESIDHKARYGIEPAAGRLWFCADQDQPPKPPRCGLGPRPDPDAHWQSWDTLPRDTRLIDQATLNRLCNLGRRVTAAWVHHPLARHRQPLNKHGELSPEAEQKTYEWFVANEKAKPGQALDELPENGDLPKLQPYDSPPGDRHGQPSSRRHQDRPNTAPTRRRPRGPYGRNRNR